MGNLAHAISLGPGDRLRTLLTAIVNCSPAQSVREQIPRGAPQRGGGLGRLGMLEVRLARSASEVRRAQELRYRVFYEHKAKFADRAPLNLCRDVDSFDAICDHLIVLDHASRESTGGAVVGTYRLLRQEIAERNGGFYSAREFDIQPLIVRHRECRFLELGRSCVLPAFRRKRTLELLWHGIWSYVLGHRIDAMFGCASLEGTSPDRLALPLAFLHHFARAPPRWRVQAWPHRYVETNRLPSSVIDRIAALRALPPIIKGYLRLGAFCADGAVIDRRFGSTDVLAILPVSAINHSYVAHFGPAAERYAAAGRASA